MAVWLLVVPWMEATRRDGSTDSFRRHRRRPACRPSPAAFRVPHRLRCSAAARAQGGMRSQAWCTGRSQARCWGCRAALAGSGVEGARWNTVSWRCNLAGSCVRRRSSIAKTTWLRLGVLGVAIAMLRCWNRELRRGRELNWPRCQASDPKAGWGWAFDWEPCRATPRTIVGSTIDRDNRRSPELAENGFLRAYSIILDAAS